MDLSALVKKRPTLVIGFPGFGMAGSIALQYLVEHASPRQIGHLRLSDPSSTFLAVHQGKPIWPITAYHDEGHNLVFIHALVPLPLDDAFGEEFFSTVGSLDPERIVVLESIGSTEEGHHATFSYAIDDRAREGLELPGSLSEGILLGASAELFSRYPERTLGIFSEAHVSVPDSEAAAQLLEILNGVFGLGMDTTELRAMSKVFEQRVKQILKNSKSAKNLSEKNQMFYVG